MRTLFALLACVTLLLSLGMASSVHAMELSDNQDVACSVEGKADSSKGDFGKDDKGVVHVHGCHGHHLAAEIAGPAPIAVLRIVSPAGQVAVTSLPEFAGEASLDPPRA